MADRPSRLHFASHSGSTGPILVAVAIFSMLVVTDAVQADASLNMSWERRVDVDHREAAPGDTLFIYMTITDVVGAESLLLGHLQYYFLTGCDLELLGVEIELNEISIQTTPMESANGYTIFLHVDGCETTIGDINRALIKHRFVYHAVSDLTDPVCHITNWIPYMSDPEICILYECEDNYSFGVTGPIGHDEMTLECVVAIEAATWGQIKSMYRGD